MSYVGTAYPRNIVSFSIGAGTTFNDNFFADNTNRRGNLSFGFTPRVAFRREGRRLTLAADYQPDFHLYHDAPERNTVNHGLQLDTRYRLSPHFDLRFREEFSYRTGLFPPRPDEEFMPELGPPTSLNETVLTPRRRALQSTTRFDVLYQRSLRSSFDFFLGWQQRDFAGKGDPDSRLRDTEGVNGGLQYLYRYSTHTTLGALYLFQNMTMGKNITDREPTRFVVHSPFFSYMRRLSPSVVLNVYGGPQYSRLHDEFVIPLGFITISGQIFRDQWHWALGGSLTKQLESTVFQVNAARWVTDGGGLLGAVTSTSAGMTVRRRLGSRWHGTWNVGVAENNALGFGLFAGNIRSVNAGFGLDRSLTEKLTFSTGYGYRVQRAEGTFASRGDINRHTFRFGINYNVGRFPLGR